MHGDLATEADDKYNMVMWPGLRAFIYTDMGPAPGYRGLGEQLNL